MFRRNFGLQSSRTWGSLQLPGKNTTNSGPFKGLYKGPYSTPPAAKVETKNHHKTMKIKVPEAEILRTPIKIEKLSLWNRSRSGFIMNFEFHGFLDVPTEFWTSPLMFGCPLAALPPDMGTFRDQRGVVPPLEL